MSSSFSPARGGVAVSLSASVLFAGIYFFTPMLAPLAGLEVWAIRVLFTIPVVSFVLLLLRQRQLFTDIWARVKARPALLFGITLSGFLVSVQLWLFSWAPLNGSGLQVALGYFLLPLVLVIVGRFVYQDRLTWWHWLAAGVAAVGVTFELLRAGGVSWETLLVCLGYPLYFMLRRKLGTASTGGLLWELIMVSPFMLFVVVRELGWGTAFSVNPSLWWVAPVISVVSAVALWLYVLASKLLSISMFGLLSYVEPALLVVAALLIGERIHPSEGLTYGFIWAAVLILMLGGAAEVLRGRRLP